VVEAVLVGRNPGSMFTVPYHLSSSSRMRCRPDEEEALDSSTRLSMGQSGWFQ
jgi:hypothetical protein